MLSIGEFSHICKVSTKTLRYYAEIGLIMLTVINPENGYRYYSIDQLETMLLINRLKSYHFSLEEIKEILHTNDLQDERLCIELIKKEKEMNKYIQEYQILLKQMNNDISRLKLGQSIMSYLDHIEVQLVETTKMNLLSIRKKVHEHEMKNEYHICFQQLLKRIKEDSLTIIAPPMVFFHDQEYTPYGLDTEFAIPIQEYVTGTRDFIGGLCLKTVVHGSYSQLPSVYIKQTEWAEKENYEICDALYEVYITDPSQVFNENEYVTEVYCPVKKKKR